MSSGNYCNYSTIPLSVVIYSTYLATCLVCFWSVITVVLYVCNFVLSNYSHILLGNIITGYF